jgi:hypothetical protein
MSEHNPSPGSTHRPLSELRADLEMRAEWRLDAYPGEAAAYQVWNEPKCGCWATIASGRGA